MKAERSGARPAGTTHTDDDVSLADFLVMLRDGWRLIAAVTALCVLIATAAAYLMTPVYRAQVLLATAAEDQSGALANLSGTFGNIAELAGVRLGGGGSSKDEAIALLKSRMLTEKFIREEDLMPLLFADRWSSQSGALQVEENDAVPTIGDAFRLWDEEIRRVETSTTSALVTLTIDWEDRVLAAKWATDLVQMANELMRTRAIVEAQASIEYLNAELGNTSVVAVQLAMNRMIESQIKSITLAKVREEYYFKVIDPAFVPDADKFVEPRRLLMIAVGFIGGALLGLMAVVTGNALRQSS